ncbi:type II toxin-antitoxin system death-on-curing family toxin [Novosphingobium sp. AAP83]|uniref:type II toxin-antitoxin system death-on-curing family toxin n=1 Tax=Novosphingobium sp. AAP83 TaxID=1523425 RepID=UPI000A7D74A2|nr:type II toxin-antitoxin system death-on-curing family toxin [Novosphingobium sp. AAP83]
MRLEPVWLDARLALAIHDRQLAEHGGPSGVRDEGALESALSRARNQWEYGEDDLCALAAAHAFGIARNHPFADGNKRTAWVLARTFLVLNSVEIAFQAGQAVATVQSLAAGELTEAELADWFRQHTVQR